MYSALIWTGPFKLVMYPARSRRLPNETTAKVKGRVEAGQPIRAM